MAGFFSASSWDAPIKPKDSLPRCGECGLSKKCYSPFMKPAGQNKRPVMFVGEAPGESEDKIGKPFVGDSGKYLRDMLRQLDFQMDDGIVTNSIICHPPKEMDKKYIDCCRPYLFQAIEKYKPKVIILLGASALESLVGTEWNEDKGVGSIDRWAGFTIPSMEYNAWICPIFHPSYLLKMNDDPVLRMIMKQHLEKALSLEEVPVNGYKKKDLESTIECIKSPDKAISRIKDLNKKKGRIAFDYETTSLKPEGSKDRILSCSFCFKGRDTFAVLVNPSVQEAISEVLQNPELYKVGWNLKFEDRWTRVKMGHPVNGWIWDGMLTAHALDNREGVTGLKFQSFIHFGVAAYEKHMDFSNMESVHPDDLLVYNGMDSLLEYKMFEVQNPQFENQ